MYSEQFMAYLAGYQNEEKEEKKETLKKEHKNGLFSFFFNLFAFVKG